MTTDAKPDRDRTAKARIFGLQARRKQADERARQVAPVIAELHAAGVTSLRGIAAELNERRIPAARGGEWQASQVRRVLVRLK